MYIDDILRIDNFNNFSRDELFEIINLLKHDLKYYKFHKDQNIQRLENCISTLNNKIVELDIMLNRQKDINNNFRKIIVRKLTFVERLTGKINLNENNSK